MKKILTFLIAISIFVACANNDDDGSENNCGEMAIVDTQLYDTATPADIISVNIIQNCMTIHYSASGCDGSTWDEQLIANDAIAESDPLQRFLTLDLNNTELCLAVIQKEMQFDLTPLQVRDTNRILLNIQGWDEAVLYEY